MEQLQFKVQTFEGPLDLLLTLIAKHKMDILDISIEQLLEQYLQAIAQLQQNDPDLASEFLEMAAHLVYIKTVSLLPKPEEGEKLRDELVGRLLEYQLCKEVAARLRDDFCGHDIFVRAMQDIPINKTYRRQHDKLVLKEAYLIAAGRGRRNLPPPTSAFTGIVTRRMVSIKGRIIAVLKQLYQHGQMPYADFFKTSDRSELVATFLALLELMKNSRITVDDDNTTVYFNRTHANDELNLDIDYPDEEDNHEVQ